jgi:hypothetical protein
MNRQINLGTKQNTQHDLFAKILITTKLLKRALMTVQFSYAPGDHGFGLKSRRGIPFGTLLDGM